MSAITKKTVIVNGIKAMQTYYKQRNEYDIPKTEVQFVYKDRFGVIINAKNMNLEETWKTIMLLDLKNLTKKNK